VAQLEEKRVKIWVK